MAVQTVRGYTFDASGVRRSIRFKKLE
jgi:hypothetical protein